MHLGFIALLGRIVSAPIFTTALVLSVASASRAARPDVRESTPGRPGNPILHHDLPLVYRATSDTTWIRVHNPGESPCSPADVSGSSESQTIEHVWCFEKAGGDSSWPALPNPQGTRHERWDHWSLFDPPGIEFSKWHLSKMNPNASAWSAWCGCDSIVGANGFANNDDACAEYPFWINKKGYGDDWNYALELIAAGASNASGSVVKFDIRYDTECNYDYLYVEYSTNNGSFWSLVRDSYPNGPAAIFNSVSGNPDIAHGGTGRSCGTDYFGNSDQFNPGGGNENWNGHDHSEWIANVDFPIPAGGAAGVRVRWRAFSDGAWSDQDGRGDTDGLAAIDNVVLTITSGGTTATDNFETGTSSPLQGRVIATENIPGAVTWSAGGLLGNTYDGWHLQFNPNYTNKGNTCDFSDDWMWAAKPAAGAIPPSANGFHFVLASPVIACDGWTGGVVEFGKYECMGSGQWDFTIQTYRVFDTNLGWSTWKGFEGFIIPDTDCEDWNPNDLEDLSPYLGAAIDSIQVAWEILDGDQPGDFDWGKHSAVQFLVDNVSFGSFDLTTTIFTARNIDFFADTFSQSDPAHTPFLQNAEQGIWSGLTAAPQGTRDFASADSLTIDIDDADGVSAANVDLWWRHDNGGVGFGAFSKIDMSFAAPDPTSPTDEGTYRAIIGKDNGGTEDAFPPANNRKIWKPATTVQYYVKVTDNAAQPSVFPNTADDSQPVYFEFSVLPFGKTTPAGQRILLVDDFTRQMLDFQNSSDFDPDGGPFGTFLDPAFDEPENMVERALVLLFGGSETAPKWDKYDVQGAGSSVQCEPRGVGSSTLGLGGYMNDAGNPTYDVLIWLQGSFDEYSFADTTRIELGTYLDRNGNFFTCGDDIAYHLGSGGNNADSAIGFLGDYLGTSFTVSSDDETLDRILSMEGVPGTSLSGIFELGLYGECPIRRAFDRLTLGVPAAGSQNSVLATYSEGNAADNGRPCIIKNARAGLDETFGTADDGIAILAGFDLSALQSDTARKCVLGKTLESDMSIPVMFPPYPNCFPGNDAPVVQAPFGFNLSPANPNPFQNSTTIRFSIAARQHVTISVHNVHGQTVRTLVDEILDANEYSREWDGRDDGGKSVANGIYFVNMRANEFSAVKKVLRIR